MPVTGIRAFRLEVGVGFEPTDNGFADRRVTTSPTHRLRFRAFVVAHG